MAESAMPRPRGSQGRERRHEESWELGNDSQSRVHSTAGRIWRCAARAELEMHTFSAWGRTHRLCSRRSTSTRRRIFTIDGGITARRLRPGDTEVVCISRFSGPLLAPSREITAEAYVKDLGFITIATYRRARRPQCVLVVMVRSSAYSFPRMAMKSMQVMCEGARPSVKFDRPLEDLLQTKAVEGALDQAKQVIQEARCFTGETLAAREGQL